jgi:eukaryotic-like serine/threonine-protein kinase
MELAVGTALQSGKYLLNHVLGQEAFSLTYRATQNYLQQPVVIKTLHPSLQASAGFGQLQNRFVEITRQLARNQHPSLVRVLDFFQEGGLPFMVMEHVSGDTLADVIQAGGPMVKPEAIHYARQLAKVLEIIHDRQLYHGNLNPQNIIRRHGTNLAVVVGFGVSHELALLRSTPNAYRAPEQTTVPHPTRAIDLYSLSAILSYLLTTHPLGPQTLTATGRPTLETAILIGLARDPQLRPANVSAWVALLPADTLPLVAPKSSPPQPAAPVPAAPSSAAAALSPAPTAPVANGAIASPQHGHPGAPPVPVPSSPASPLSAPPTPAPNGAIASPRNGHPGAPPAPVPPSPQSAASPSTITLWANLRQPQVWRKVGLVGAIATAIGFGFGLAVRFSASKHPGFTFLNPNQTFSERDWQGTKSPSMKQSDVPVEQGSISDIMDPLGEVEPVQRSRAPRSSQPSEQLAPAAAPNLPAPVAPVPAKAAPVAPPAPASPAVMPAEPPAVAPAEPPAATADPISPAAAPSPKQDPVPVVTP